ncbi:MAG TPA: peptide chain release factor N(5)-glutamine methyltransferase [Synechococcales bacterium UBA12195]|nr:MAG: peptide chain release factor N(5)-glutamine methyltransferase [Synechococcus sp. MED-G67]HCV57337.1 peptide chain release factor N(5)-glutamine methyltransferase [Synechococcales bacterium UBA12195]|tara:strand:- start:2470 stop:3354 length:885 start_codon:yes stop_codon:yes gene_type:complete
MTCLSGSELQLWRREQLLGQQDQAAALDWLLELEAGLRWRELQASYLHPEAPVQLDCSLQRLEQIWQQHCQQQVPLQHLVGRCPWRDFELEVSPAVLIPRQETELLVELAMGCFEASDAPQRWADLGTGSGCLAVALARHWPSSCGWAVDCSREALAVARRNAAALGLLQSAAVQWCEGLWWQPLQPLAGQLDLVVSNPPYIPSAVVDGLEPVVRDHEPRLALDGGSDGLDALRLIIEAAPQMLAPGGWLVLEHHHDQAAAVAELLGAAGLQERRQERDLEGQMRFAVARRSNP